MEEERTLWEGWTAGGEAQSLEMFILVENKTGFPAPDVSALRLVKCWTYRWCWICFAHSLWSRNGN